MKSTYFTSYRVKRAVLREHICIRYLNSFEEVYLGKNIHFIFPATLWNSTTIHTPLLMHLRFMWSCDHLGDELQDWKSDFTIMKFNNSHGYFLLSYYVKSFNSRGVAWPFKVGGPSPFFNAHKIHVQKKNELAALNIYFNLHFCTLWNWFCVTL